MALRKISDLPGLSPENREFTLENFGESLVEVSYRLSSEGDPSYVSRYMTAKNFLSAAYQSVPPGEVELRGVYEKIGELSGALSSVVRYLSGFQEETWLFYPMDQEQAVAKNVYVAGLGG